MTPKEELRLLSHQVDQAAAQPDGLEALKPLFLRLDELSRDHSHDF